jgi:hypothetical protein
MEQFNFSKWQNQEMALVNTPIIIQAPNDVPVAKKVLSHVFVSQHNA